MELRTTHQILESSVSDSLSECQDRLGPEEETCLREVLQELQTEARELSALEAQQDVAAWSLILLFVTAGSLVIGAGGLIALVWTFLRTRQQAQEQSRAYFAIDQTTVRKVPSGFMDGRYTFHVSFEMKNSGKTPALDVTFYSRVGLLSREEIKSSNPIDPTSRGVQAPGQVASVGVVLPFAYSDEDIRERMGEGRTIRVRGRLKYKDVYGQSWLHSFEFRMANLSHVLSENDAVCGGDPSFVEYPLTVGDDFNSIERVSESNRSKLFSLFTSMNNV